MSDRTATLYAKIVNFEIIYFRNGVDEDFEIWMAVDKHESAVTDKISSWNTLKTTVLKQSGSGTYTTWL